jgi:pimeloyl-ACP methyl ester carboxylesterase
MRKSLIAFASAAAGVAGIGLFNKSVTLGEGELESQLPVSPTMWRWRQGNVAVYEQGSMANPPLLLVHGHNAAASAHEMREPFARFADDYHVFAPDLLGYGLSDRPDIDYTPELYISLIRDLLREVVGRPATVVASSLSAAYAIEVAASELEWVTRLVLVCPTGVRRLLQQSGGGKALEGVLGLPLVGQALFYGIASKPSIRGFLRSQTYYDKSLVTDALVDANYRTAHVPGAQYAPAAFVSGKLYHDASDAWARLEQEVLLVWGREASITPISDAVAFLSANPQSELRTIERAGILPQDEQPEQFARAVQEWIALRTGP